MVSALGNRGTNWNMGRKKKGATGNVATATPGCQHQNPCPPGEAADRLVNLFEAVTVDRRATSGTQRLPHPGEESAEEVVEAGQGGHRGARALSSPILVDGYGGSQSGYLLNLRGTQPANGGGGQRLQCEKEPAPGLGVDGVEGQRGLPGAGDAAEGDEAPVRDIQVQVLQVVHTGLANRKVCSVHWFNRKKSV